MDLSGLAVSLVASAQFMSETHGGLHPFHRDHRLALCPSDSGWSCDGASAPGGCRGNGGGAGQRRCPICTPKARAGHT